jgi:hypothetical protein
LWLLGFAIHIGGGFIHLLFILVLILLIAHFLGGRRSTV